MLIVPIAYLIKQCGITNLVGWWVQQSSIGIFTIYWRKSWGSWGKNWCSSYMPSFWQLSDNSFWYEFQLFGLWQFRPRTMVTNMGMNWSLCEYSTSNRCLHCLRNMWWKGKRMVPLYPYKIWPYLRPACYGWCLPYLQQKIEHQFMSGVDMKRKKTQTWHQSWYTASRRFMRRYDI